MLKRETPLQFVHTEFVECWFGLWWVHGNATPRQPSVVNLIQLSQSGLENFSLLKHVKHQGIYLYDEMQHLVMVLLSLVNIRYETPPRQM